MAPATPTAIVCANLTFPSCSSAAFALAVPFAAFCAVWLALAAALLDFELALALALALALMLELTLALALAAALDAPGPDALPAAVGAGGSTVSVINFFCSLATLDHQLLISEGMARYHSSVVIVLPGASMSSQFSVAGKAVSPTDMMLGYFGSAVSEAAKVAMRDWKRDIWAGSLMV